MKKKEKNDENLKFEKQKSSIIKFYFFEARGLTMKNLMPRDENLFRLQLILKERMTIF